MKKLSFIVFTLLITAFAEPAIPQTTTGVFGEHNLSAQSETVNRGLHIFTFFEIDDSPDSDDSAVSEGDFKRIIEEITSGEYNVVSVSDGLSRVSEVKSADKSLVSLTFDGGYRSFFEKAFPALKEKNIPFVLFITPEQIGRNRKFMNWDEIKTVSEAGNATVALQSDYYVPLTARSDNDIRAGLNRAVGIFLERLGFKPEYIAYPFGLYDERTLHIIKEYEFIKAGFGLQSSPIDGNTPIMTLPRFVLTGDYADIDRFKIIADTLPLPVKETVPSRSSIVNKDAPVVGFTVDEKVKNIKGISCFGTGYGKIKTEFLGNRVELRFPELPEEGYRMRINCTLPYKSPVDGAENLYWYGVLIQPR